MSYLRWGLTALAAVTFVMPASAQNAPGINPIQLAQFWRRDDQPVPPGGMRGDRERGENGDDSELLGRIQRLENSLRQLTGQVEQLQYQNDQLRRALEGLSQGDNQSPRTQLQKQQQQRNIPPLTQQAPPPQVQQDVPPPQGPRGRNDVFDPDANPNAPGAPRNLGQVKQQQQRPQGPQGPMVLSPNDRNDPQDLPPPGGNPNQPNVGPQAVLPPSGSPKDEYDLAYGYILRRDYALAEQSFRGFLDRHQGDRNVPQATYWLGESLFAQKKYNDAAEVFLDIYNKYPNSQRAPDALLRLGQSLALLNKKEAACASLGAVSSKYPKASAQVKKNVEDEQKRLGC